MGVNFTPSLEPYKETGSFRVWCQKVLPLVYDDSLSYYELLCKVVNYLNDVISNVDGLKIDIDKLLNAFNELQNYVNNYFDNLDVQEEINNKLDEMVENGVFDSILTKLAKNINEFSAQRIFRIISSEQNGTTGIGQCVGFTGNTFLFCGSFESNTKQRIIETSLDGHIQRNIELNSESLGHFNSVCYLDNTLYAVNGTTTNNIIQIDYTTMAITNVFSQTIYNNIYGISAYNNKIYCLGYKKTGDPLEIFIFDPETENYETVCNVVEPQTYSFNLIRQSFTVYENFAYLFYNYSNTIVKVNLSTGDIVNTINIGQGDGFFPFGEVESGCFVNGQLYIMGSCYSRNDSTQGFVGLFKTNIGGIAINNAPYTQSIGVDMTLWIDNTKQLNPNGTQNNAFESFEELACVLNYLLSQNISISNVYFNNSNYVNERVNINNANMGISFSNTPSIAYFSSYNSKFHLNNAVIQSFYMRYGEVVLSNSNVNTLNLGYSKATLYSTTINNGIYNYSLIVYGIGNSAQSTVNYTMTNSNIIGNILSMPGNLSVGASPATIEWNTTIYETLVKVNSDTFISCFIGVAGQSLSYLRFRLTTSNIISIKQGNDIIATTNAIVTDGTNYYACTITLTINNIGLTFTRIKCVKLSDNSDADITLTIYDINLN